jgi:quinol monooxygenase YgiN
MNHYYVYYKVAPERVDELRNRVRVLFDSIQKQCGVRGRWMRRRDDPSTFMEVYEDVQDPAAFEAALAHEATELGVERKLERFVCA